MSAANTLADLNEAAKAVLQCLKVLPEQGDVRIALIGGLALWNYLPQYRSTTDADFIITNNANSLLASQNMKKALIAQFPASFEQRAAVFFYKSPQGKLIQIDFPVQDTAPYVPAQATPIKDLRPGQIPMITKTELIVFKIEVCGRRLEAPKKMKDADDAYNLLVDATRDGNLRLNSHDKQIIEACLPDVLKHSSSGQPEKWWRQKLGLPVSRTPSPTRPRGLSPKPKPAAGASKPATGASKPATGASKPATGASKPATDASKPPGT